MLPTGNHEVSEDLLLVSNTELLNIINNTFDNKINDIKNGTLLLQEQLEKKDGEINALRTELVQLKAKMEEDAKMKNEAETENMVNAMSTMNDRIDCAKRDLGKELIKVADFLDERNLYLKNLFPNIACDHIWRITKFSTKKGTAISSDSFYSHKYKLRLCCFIFKDGATALCCQIQTGVYDDDVTWPLELSVTLSFINQKTARPQNSDTYQYVTCDPVSKGAFRRPLNRVNIRGIGDGRSLCSASKMASIIHNNSIIISCLLENP